MVPHSQAFTVLSMARSPFHGLGLIGHVPCSRRLFIAKWHNAQAEVNMSLAESSV
ncbi:hypothetical protein IF1G_07978 [Cordyceps javanica]|uniref:Uncharacterized protein n=1 Tax=Cordyceps javanica TaxID=43265 RepID=A0A545UVC0_9HYPO|nr:hypothetical protein IF1G_07978 [Cordyceps javanica]